MPGKRPETETEAWRPRKILVLTAELEVLRRVATDLLREDGALIAVPDAREAVERVRAERPDVVVLDVMTPSMHGFEVLKKLKADPSTAEIPVLMLADRVQDADVFRGWQSAAYGPLPEPFNLMDLLRSRRGR